MRRRLYIERVLLCAAVGLTGFLAWRGLSANWRFTTDDAYITLRYAKNLYTGHGVVWNWFDPIPVEGYSNYLFVLFGAAALATGVDPVLTLKVCGVGGLLLTLCALWVLARGYVGKFAAFIPGWMLLAYRGESYWAGSGLETTTYQGLVLASLATLFHALGFRPKTMTTAFADTAPLAPMNPRALLVSCLLMLLASFTRPEALVVVPFMAIALAWRARFAWRPWALVGGAFALPLAIYHAWRVAHFGSFIGHSVVCKVAYEGDTLALLRDYWKLVFPLGLLAFLRPWRAWDIRHLPLIGIPLIYGALLYDVDPIIGQYNRHALLAYALLLISIVTNFVELVRWLLERGFRRWVNLAPIVGEAALTVGATCYSYVELGRSRHSMEQAALGYEARMAARVELAAWLSSRAHRTDSILIGDAGLVPYAVDAEFIDAYCLNCLAFTASPVSSSAERFADWVFEQHPRYIIVHSTSPNKILPHPFYDVYPTLVRHAAFREKYLYRTTFGARGDEFQYLVFEREDASHGAQR